MRSSHLCFPWLEKEILDDLRPAALLAHTPLGPCLSLTFELLEPPGLEILTQLRADFPIKMEHQVSCNLIVNYITEEVYTVFPTLTIFIKKCQ